MLTITCAAAFDASDFRSLVFAGSQTRYSYLYSRQQRRLGLRCVHHQDVEVSVIYDLTLLKLKPRVHVAALLAYPYLGEVE